MQNIKNKIYRLLRWSEKYMKTDMIYLAKGGFWLTIGQILASLSALILALIFANFLTKETYGTYKYIISLLGVLSIFNLSGLNLATTKAVAQGYEGAINFALQTKIKFSLIGSFLSLITSIYYYLNHNSTLALAFLLIAIFLPVITNTNIYGCYFEGKKLFKEIVKYRSITQIISTLFIIVSVIVTRNALIIVLTYFLSYAVFNFIFFIITKIKYNLNNKINSEVKKYSTHLSIINIINTLAGNLDSILLWHFLGAAPLAIYSFAMAPVVQFRALMKSTTTLSLPKLSNIDIKHTKKDIVWKSLKMLAIISPPVLLYIVLAPYLFYILFPQYIASVKYTQLFAVILLFFPKKLLSLSVMLHTNKKDLYISGISPSFVRIIALITLTPLYGIYGAITAAIATEIFTVIMTVYFFKKL